MLVSEIWTEIEAITGNKTMLRFTDEGVRIGVRTEMEEIYFYKLVPADPRLHESFIEYMSTLYRSNEVRYNRGLMVATN